MTEAIINLVFIVAGFIMGRMTKPVATNKEEAPQPYKVINMPNPLQAYREHKEREEDRKEIERLEIIMENIEKYDGTGAGQKDVPTRS